MKCFKKIIGIIIDLVQLILKKEIIIIRKTISNLSYVNMIKETNLAITIILEIKLVSIYIKIKFLAIFSTCKEMNAHLEIYVNLITVISMKIKFALMALIAFK